MYAEAGFGFCGYSPGLLPEFSPPVTARPPRPAGGGGGGRQHGELPPPGGYELLPGFGCELPEFGAHLGNMTQASIISEYDLGGEGDLFKAPEPIIEEPELGLDPTAATISMISCSDDVITKTMEVADIGSIQNDPLLSQVFYECQKDLLEKCAFEESISELLEVKISPLQVEEVPRKVESLSMEQQKSVAEGPLQKSVSSGCLNTVEWINGPIRPNFLDFQGLDFEAAFGMRRAYSEGDIPKLGSSSTGPANATSVQSSSERLLTSSDLKTEERRQKLSRYRKKKVKRNFGRKIKYACRKALADNQPRVRGRFAKIEECEVLKPKKKM